MSKPCGDSVMETHLALQLEEGGLIPTSPLQFKFEVISAKAACELNAKWHSRFPDIHWSNVVRNKYYICYGAKFEGNYFAISIWSSPIARKLDASSILELRRMAINADCPKNTASRMLSWMRKDIQKRFPEIKKLISYQDTEAHNGTIYKASGWGLINTMTKQVDWSASGRKRSKPQSPAPKVRWEYNLES
jgi:hypothetical protein